MPTDGLGIFAKIWIKSNYWINNKISGLKGIDLENGKGWDTIFFSGL